MFILPKFFLDLTEVFRHDPESLCPDILSGVSYLILNNPHEQRIHFQCPGLLRIYHFLVGSVMPRNCRLGYPKFLQTQPV